MYLDEQFRLKVGLAEMLKGGVIMDVTNAEQAVIAEKAGAAAVMALERVPSDIRKEGGVARMAPISKIREIMQTVSHSGDGESAYRPLHGGSDSRSRSKSTTSMRAKCSRLPMKSTTSTSAISACRSFAARAIWAKRCGGSLKARR